MGGSICTDSDNCAVTGAQSVDHLYPRDVPASARPSRPFCLKMTHKNHLTHKQETGDPRKAAPPSCCIM